VVDGGELIIVNSISQNSNYKIIDCSPATRILYLANNFLSGHVRMRAKNNGRYPTITRK
jgi:hypothetical protein